MREFFLGAASVAALALASACAGGGLGDTCSSNSDCPKVGGQQSMCLNQNGGLDGGPGYLICEPPGACSVDNECQGQATGSCQVVYTVTGQEADYCTQVTASGPVQFGCNTLADCPNGAIACQNVYCPLLAGGACATSADCQPLGSGFPPASCVNGVCLEQNYNACIPLADQNGNPTPNLCVFPNAT